jgi:hypothetical protein
MLRAFWVVRAVMKQRLGVAPSAATLALLAGDTGPTGG